LIFYRYKANIDKPVVAVSINGSKHSAVLVQIMKNLIRITKLTSRILDLVLVSDPNKIMNIFVISYNISDHQMIYCTRQIRKAPCMQTCCKL